MHIVLYNTHSSSTSRFVHFLNDKSTSFFEFHNYDKSSECARLQRLIIRWLIQQQQFLSYTIYWTELSARVYLCNVLENDNYINGVTTSSELLYLQDHLKDLCSTYRNIKDLYCAREYINICIKW